MKLICFATLSKSLNFSLCSLYFCPMALENPVDVVLDVTAPTPPSLPSAKNCTPEHQLPRFGLMY